MGYWQNLGKSIIGYEKEGNDYFYTLLSNAVNWGKKSTEKEKITAVLENPAALFIFLLLPELFSLGVWKLTKDDKLIKKHPLLDLLRKPNPMQSGDQFLWDYMFKRKLGTANLYIDSKVVSPKNKLYFLDSDVLKFPLWFENNSKRLILSDETIKEMNKKELTYDDKNQSFKFPYEKLVQFFDISNGINGWFNSPSRVDAIYKIIDNSEKALQSKNINVEFSSKFLVSGKVSVEDTSKMPMGQEDKGSIRQSMRSKENVFPIKTQVDINRFIESGQIISELDKSFMNDAFIIGKMLNIPKDVIEMLGDSTYENQEKARASVISYCINPDANDLAQRILDYFDMNEYQLELDYSYLPFVQVFESEKAKANRDKAFAFDKLVRSGADPMEAAILLGMESLTKFGDISPPTQTRE
jgi:hypothetical protein